MDGQTPTPNQWNPETPDDDLAFDRYMRRLSAMTDEAYVKQEAKAAAKPLPELPALLPDKSNFWNWFGVAFSNFLVERGRKYPSPFPKHTPEDARRYCARYPLKQGDQPR